MLIYENNYFFVQCLPNTLVNLAGKACANNSHIYINILNNKYIYFLFFTEYTFLYIYRVYNYIKSFTHHKIGSFDIKKFIFHSQNNTTIFYTVIK